MPSAGLSRGSPADRGPPSFGPDSGRMACPLLPGGVVDLVDRFVLLILELVAHRFRATVLDGVTDVVDLLASSLQRTLLFASRHAERQGANEQRHQALSFHESFPQWTFAVT